MAVQDLLSQDEIDALLHGVDDGLVETEDEAEPGSVKQYDLTSQDRIVRGRMPTTSLVAMAVTPRSRGVNLPRPSCAWCAWCWIRPLSTSKRPGTR